MSALLTIQLIQNSRFKIQDSLITIVVVGLYYQTRRRRASPPSLDLLVLILLLLLLCLLVIASHVTVSLGALAPRVLHTCSSPTCCDGGSLCLGSAPLSIWLYHLYYLGILFLCFFVCAFFCAHFLFPGVLTLLIELACRLVVCDVFLRDVHLQFILINALANAGDSRGLSRYLLFDVGMGAY